MFATPRQGPRLSLSQKMSRLRLRLRDAEWRRYGGTLLLGKVTRRGIGPAHHGRCNWLVLYPRLRADRHP